MPCLLTLKEDTKKASLLAKLIHNREVIKNYQTELSIQTFYQRAGLKCDVSMNMGLTPINLKNSFLPSHKKVLNEAR